MEKGLGGEGVRHVKNKALILLGIFSIALQRHPTAHPKNCCLRGRSTIFICSSKSSRPFDRKLIINKSEANTVRLIFRRYAELGSVTLLRKELAAQGIVSKRREGGGGRLSGGQKLSRGALYLMLQNRIYCGEIKHKGNAYPGQHEAIIDSDIWQVVQDKLATNRQERVLGVGAESPSLLAGLIVDAEGQRLTPTHANKRGKRYRYYISTSLLDGKRRAGQGTFRLPADEIEGLALDRLRAFLASRSGLAEAMAPIDLSAGVLEAVLHRASQLAARWQTLPSTEVMKFVRSSVDRVSVASDHVEVIVDGAKLLNALGGGQASKQENLAPIVLSIAANLRRAGKGKRLVIAGNAHREIDPNLISLLRHAFATRAAFLSGTDNSLSAMTERLGMGHGQLVALVRLSYLAPDLISSFRVLLADSGRAGFAWRADFVLRGDALVGGSSLCLWRGFDIGDRHFRCSRIGGVPIDARITRSPANCEASRLTAGVRLAAVRAHTNACFSAEVQVRFSCGG